MGGCSVFAHPVHTGFMAESSNFLYNLESLPHFDKTHEYGYISVFITTVIREGLEAHPTEAG
jgi:hypothetical protein